MPTANAASDASANACSARSIAALNRPTSNSAADPGIAHPRSAAASRPTASLDAQNRDVVCEMIEAKTAAGTAVLGIFHDAAVRERIATRIIDVSAFSARKAA